MAGVLYVVATPIGNLEDISLRALRILKEVDLIAAEDTRHTRILLGHYDIRTALTSYHEHNEKTQAPRLIERLQRGDNIAVVSDAGTPVISDPGFRLVAEALRAGFRVVPVPGPSALAAILSASGLPTDRFVFEGFLPAKAQERARRLSAIREETRSMVFYEAPHRLKESLNDMRRFLGNREIVIGREMTKVHEEFLRGTIDEVLEALADREIKGEVTVVVRGASSPAAVSQEEVETEIRRLAEEGLGVKQISAIVSARFQVAKREVYQLALRLRGAPEKR